MIQLDKITVKSSDQTILSNISLIIHKSQQWVILGSNGSGKSALAQLIGGQLKPTSGTRAVPNKVETITFEVVTEILDHERYLDNSNTCGGFDQGTLARDFVFSNSVSRQDHDALETRFNLSAILDRGIKFLSTGEMRKVLICKALINQPDLLILDEPFDGLDVESRGVLTELIEQIREDGIQVLLLLNRSQEVPPQTTHIGFMEAGKLITTTSYSRNALKIVSKCQDSINSIPQPMPETQQQSNSLNATASLIEMNGVHVSYREKPILTGINWTVKSGEQWMISGPNGSGKTTLLNLITGDNTQAYANDIKLFGKQKGCGESIWDIKQKIGHISTAFQRDYRVGGSVVSVILSGYFDTIGVYSKHTPKQIEICHEWLNLLNMSKMGKRPFQSLSFGQKRLILLARAMIKQPQILILDEPFQGLDDENRDILLSICQQIVSNGHTHLLYVTHHFEDRIPCINKHLELVKSDDGGFTSLTNNL